ncbi:hypothetical protein LTR53_010673 [Teratosphaeriaceae sp. CCFEE 6253]|nr:hypothetical protein LTR53_010673 [Teratosphaeriaceae sp. CCFEE 6253]
MAETLAIDGTVRNLDHIYFFIDKSTRTAACHEERSQSPTSNILSRSASPSIGSSDGSGTGSASSSNSLNPLAKDFKPTSTATQAPSKKISRFYEVRESQGKGLGLFAIDHVPIGTCIVAEAPLVQISENSLYLAWGSYCRLSNPQKTSFDALHLYKPEHLNLEHTSRSCLIDYNDQSLDAEDIEELVQDQVRVMGIFACNNFRCRKGLAVFDTTSRINHSCVPNVHHSFNPTLQKETVYAIRDIQPGEELCTTYLGGPGVYHIRAQRIETLRTNYGFTCTCPACSDVTRQSDGRRDLMTNVAYGLQVFQYGDRSPDVPFVPTSPGLALKQAEDLIHLLLDEGIFSVELCKAYRVASSFALNIGHYDKAREYALAEADVEQHCLGTALDDLVKCNAAASCWIEKVRQALVKAGIFRPDQKLRKPKAPVTEQQKTLRKQRQARKAAKKTEEKAEKAAAQKTRTAELREQERKRKEYDAAFPDLKA